MPKNDFKAFATASGANVLSQEDYNALTAASVGWSSGVAKSSEVNKAIRQATFIAAALAQYTANKSGLDVLDDGNLSGFIAKMSSAFGQDYQALDATLTALAALSTGANKLPYFTDTDKAAQTDLTSVGRDIIGKATITDIIQYLGLNDTVNKAGGALQKSGDTMTGPLGLTQVSSFGIGNENTIGGASIAIGDNDSGFKSGGDGIINFIANGVVAGYFDGDELQHSAKMLTKIFQVITDNNATAGAGGLDGQLASTAPFFSPRIVRPNNDNNYFPFWKQNIGLQSGYPVAASMGMLTTGQTNFPQIVIQAKTDTNANDRLWVFDVATGELRCPSNVRAGPAILNSNGDITGSEWGGQLSNWINSQLALIESDVNDRATTEYVNSQISTLNGNINSRATTDYVNSNFNRLNTGTLGFSGWTRDSSTGLIMQWGNVDNAKGTYSFPRAFTTNCYAVFATNKDGQGGAIDNAYGYPVSNTQFFLASKANSGQDTAYGISWFALGF